ncbi:hypothetical protein [Reichenbachiella sp. MALMAid0571]|uniref:hypothetical protein n=1 Tax=Reichenbachiella sp. MALMAid0571 TaxID=3143939 RepID=UPI0032E04E25
MEIKSAVGSLFVQLRFVLENLTEKQFKTPSVSLSGATVGQHIRHSLEFFTCLTNSIESGIVNYDKRERNQEIEENTELALELLNHLAVEVNRYSGKGDLTLELSYSHINDDSLKVKSNFDRELVYNIEHAIHHLALIKIGLTEVAPEIELPKGFGIANSTIRYKNQQEKV